MTILYDPLAVPDVSDLTISFNPPTEAHVYWTWPPQKLSTALYDGAYWTGVNLTDFSPYKVNDGELGDLAWKWTAGGASYLVYDSGAGNAIECVEFWYSYDSTVDRDEPAIWYSDDGSAWTSVTLILPLSLTRIVDHAGSNMKTAVRRWASVGAHRFWRAGDSSVTNAGFFTEAWFRAYAGDVEDAQAVLLYDLLNGGRELWSLVASNKMPTADTPYSLVGLSRGGYGISFAITVLTANGESAGWEYTSFTAAPEPARSEFVRQDEELLFLINGLNSDIDLPSGPRDVFVNASSGVTANFSLGGFIAADFTGGETFTVWNWTAFTMTVKHNDTLSAAPNRNKVLAGADVNIVGNGYATFKRSGDQTLWIFVGGRDSTGYK